MLRDCGEERPNAPTLELLRQLYRDNPMVGDLADQKCFIARHASGPEACDQCIRKAVLNMGIEFP